MRTTRQIVDSAGLAFSQTNLGGTCRTLRLPPDRGTFNGTMPQLLPRPPRLAGGALKKTALTGSKDESQSATSLPSVPRS